MRKDKNSNIITKERAFEDEVINAQPLIKGRWNK
jgi:hypothetical protein